MPFMSESSPATLPVTTALGLTGMTIERDLVLSAQYLDEAAAAVADLPGVPVPGTAAPRRGRQRRGHAHADRPAAGWIPTDERFRDPASRAVMRVWVDPADQSRHYVPEPDA